jgi:hypothetical protein
MIPLIEHRDANSEDLNEETLDTESPIQDRAPGNLGPVQFRFRLDTWQSQSALHWSLISFKEKYFVQRDRVIVFFNDIPEALNRLQDVLLVMSAQGLAQ